MISISFSYFSLVIAKSFTQEGRPKLLFNSSTARAKLSAPSSIVLAGKPKSFAISKYFLAVVLSSELNLIIYGNIVPFIFPCAIWNFPPIA